MLARRLARVDGLNWSVETLEGCDRSVSSELGLMGKKEEGKQMKSCDCTSVYIREIFARRWEGEA